MGLLLPTLLAIYAICSTVALFFLWRRVERLDAELSTLRASVSSRARAARAQNSPVVSLPQGAGPRSREGRAEQRAIRIWRLPQSTPGDSPAYAMSMPLAPETLRGVFLGAVATAPSLGFFFGADPAVIVASGLAIAAAMMITALRADWRSAAWPAVFTASAWATLGFALRAAHADETSYSICAAFAGAAGLLYAYLRQRAQGAAMALAMSAATLALASEIGMASAAGTAFGGLVVLGAIAGALSLRLEAIHLAAFGAAIIGLFTLSGQASAAIWFTPATSWAGALFLAIAAVRVPQLGARGVALAGTGAFGALGAILSLFTAQHGLADPFATAIALVILAAIIGCIIALSALRRDRGLQALHLSLWLPALAAFVAFITATSIALPPQLASPALSLATLALTMLNARFPDGTWRVFAGAAALLAAPFEATTASMILAETSDWPAWLLVTTGLCAPAVGFATAALFAARHGAPRLAALLEMLVMGLGIAATNLLVRVLFSDGALLLQPIGFVETAVHTCVWLLAALAIGARAHLGAQTMRVAAANLLTVAAIGVMAVAAMLWSTDYWGLHSSGPQILRRQTLGFLLPAIMCFAHWVFWRARADDMQTRLVFGASMLMFAAFLTMEAMRAQHLPDWTRALVGAISFAMALGLNFAPGIVNADGPPQREKFQKQLHRNGIRKQRAETRERAH